MAPVGRKRRLSSIVQRSQTFEKDLARQRVSNDIKRDRKIVHVGLGIHKRLVAKKNRWHVKRVAIQEKTLLVHFKSKNIVPEHYKLVKVGFDSKTGIQEYFQRPTLNALERFFGFKQGKERIPLHLLEKKDVLICKQFLGKYKKVTLEQVEAASKEIFKHLAEIGEIGQIRQNIVVVGVTRDGKLRLAMIDV